MVYDPTTPPVGAVCKVVESKKVRGSRYIMSAPCLSSNLCYGGHNDSLVNLLRAWNERVMNVERNGTLVPTPKPVPGQWETVSGYFQKLVEHVGSMKQNLVIADATRLLRRS